MIKRRLGPHLVNLQITLDGTVPQSSFKEIGKKKKKVGTSYSLNAHHLKCSIKKKGCT